MKCSKFEAVCTHHLEMSIFSTLIELMSTHNGLCYFYPIFMYFSEATLSILKIWEITVMEAKQHHIIYTSPIHYRKITVELNVDQFLTNVRSFTLNFDIKRCSSRCCRVDVAIVYSYSINPI
jgi:hypothetical protein